jgi:hypothetical protein
MAIVYLHRRLDTNDVFYVGIGAQSKRAYLKIGRNKHWHNIVNKFGYSIEITHDNIIWEEACSIEKYLISFYGRNDLSNGSLCNLTDGGDGVSKVIFTQERKDKIRNKAIGRKLSPEHIEKMRQANKNKIISIETREKLVFNWLGKTHSESTRDKLRKANLGKKHSDETKEKMRLSKIGKKASEETKLKMSESRKGEKNPNFGRVFDEEIRKNMAKAQLGRKHSDETKKKMRDSKIGITYKKVVG